MLSPFLVGLYVFVLSVFTGRELLSKVPHTLHTPLMSGANAISGITIVGALACASFDNAAAAIVGAVAVAAATANIVGGYLVTDRMLKKFAKR
jgi:H+-translocating NAD(P) transhydrogenase subunit alpha